MIEAALGRCSDEWKAQNTEINTKLDMMLELQKQRLELDRAHLEFERQMAGLPAAKVNAKGRSTRKRRKGTSSLHIFELMYWHRNSLFVCPPPEALLLPNSDSALNGCT